MTADGWAALVAVCVTLLVVRPAAPVSRPGGRRRPARPVDLRMERFVTDDRWRTVACCVAGGVLGGSLRGPVGAVVAALAGAGVAVVVGRLESPAVARAREETRRAMPVAVDLLAAAAAVGRPPDQALAHVAGCIGGPLGGRLHDISARLSLGADATTEWRRHLDDPEIGPLARTMLRTLESGAPLAAGLGKLAADRRRALRASQDARARSVGVKTAAPLGLCFLPAFMIIGVVPTIVGMFRHVFGS